MKIVHFCLSSFFVDGQLYQENELVREHVNADHDVMVVASTEVYDERGYITYTVPGDYIGTEGARVIRLPYRCWLPHFLARKIRSYPSVRAILDQFAPDVIMFHGSSAWELSTVTTYVYDNPEVVFHIDSHSDEFNSGQGVLSKKILHKKFYAPILRRALVVSGPLLCVSLSVIDFAQNVYGVPRDQLEFYPLGGRIIDSDTRDAMRTSVRQRMQIGNAQILIIQSGKQNLLKKLPMSLTTFAKVKDQNLRLAIVGVLHTEIKAECEELIAADPRVTFVGWKGPHDLTELLCAADVYMQPGSQSATMQHSLCCGCAIILNDIPAHKPYINGNGWVVSSTDDLFHVLNNLSSIDIERYKAFSSLYSSRKLNYVNLAKRILN